MARYNHRPALRTEFRNTDFENFVEPGDDSLNTAAFLQIDDRVTDRGENVAGADDIGEAEIHNAVAVRMRRRDMKYLNTLTVEELAELVKIFVIGIRRQLVARQPFLAGARVRHPIQHVLMCDQRGALVAASGGGDVPTCIGHSGRYDSFIAAGVIRIHARIDDVAYRLRRSR